MAYQQVLTTNNLENVTPGPKSQEFWQAIKDANSVDEKLDILFNDDYEVDNTEEVAD